jgi:phage baseplate assembly protein V
MMREVIARHIEPLQARVRSMLLRGLVTLVSEASGLRVVQVTTRAGDDPDDAEHWEPAGFSCRPLVGAEMLVGRLGGAADVPVVLVVVDRRYRPQDCSAGETTIYDQTTPGAAQQRIRLRPGTGIQVNAPLGVSVTGGLTATTVRSGDGLTGVWTGTDGETMTFAGGVCVACTPPAV